jgi:hypothetical protein
MSCIRKLKQNSALQKKLDQHPGRAQQQGSVTLVLADVEGSADLWGWSKSVTSDAIRQETSMLRSVLALFGGHELTAEGDCFLAAFHQPEDALGWCLTSQLALHGKAWHSGRLCRPRGERDCLARTPAQAAQPLAFNKHHIRAHATLIMQQHRTPSASSQSDTACTLRRLQC